MDAVVLREAGGIGDIVQIGASTQLLHRAGYVVHMYVLADPAVVEATRLLRSVDYIHPLRMTIPERRFRNTKDYTKHHYLHSVLAHSHGTTHAQGPTKHAPSNKLFDMFCPAWAMEIADIKNGSPPKFSRAEIFAIAAGFRADMAVPARLRQPQHTDGLMEHVRRRLGSEYSIFAPYAKDPIRSVVSRSTAIRETLVKEIGPIVVLDYGSAGYSDPKAPRYMPGKGILWFPQDFPRVPDRGEAVHQMFELIRNSQRVIGVESGPVHVAASYGKPVVLMCGPTLADVAMRYHDKVYPCVPVQGPKCSGCYYQERRGCKPKCRNNGCVVLANMTPDLIAATAKETMR